MKINIWINKREAVSGNITKYYNVAPQSSDWPDYVQVTVSQDEFARLEDRELNKSRKLTWSELDEISMRPSQHNTLDNAYQANKSQAMIHERNPDTGEIRSRKMMVQERIEENEDDNFKKFVFSLTGGEFQEWYDRASEEEKEAYSKLLDNLKSKQNR